MEYAGTKKALLKVGDRILEFAEAVENYENVEGRYSKGRGFEDALEEVKAKNKAFCSAKKLAATMRKVCEEIEEKLEALEALEATLMLSRGTPPPLRELEKFGGPLSQDFEVPSQDFEALLPGDHGVLISKMTVKEIIEGLGVELPAAPQ